jgi:hypothetical protein
MSSLIKLYTLESMRKAVVVSATSEATGHLKESLNDFNPDTYWKPTTTANQYLAIDLVSAKTVDAAGFWIHNYNVNYADVGGTSKFQINYSDNGTSWTGAGGAAAIVNTVGHPIYFITISESAHRYWRLVFTDMNASELIEISMVWLFTKYDLGQGNQNPEMDELHYHNRIFSGPGDRVFTMPINENPVQILPRKFIIPNSTNYTALENAFRASYGNRYPVLLQEGTTLATAKLCHIIGGSLNKNMARYSRWEPEIVFKTLPYIAAGENY